MKSNSFLICLFLFFCGANLVSQIDSTVNSSQSDTSIGIGDNLSEKLNYLDANFRQEKSLFKIGIAPLTFIKYFEYGSELNYSTSLSFEQKMVPSVSFITNNRFYFSYFGEFAMKYSVDFGIRYYYSMKKRMREKLGSNNFHSNYFSVMIEDCGRYSIGYLSDMNAPNLSDPAGRWIFEPSYTLSWGVQRRLGKIGFIDMGPYIAYRSSFYGDVKNFNLGFKFLFGLGLGK